MHNTIHTNHIELKYYQKQTTHMTQPSTITQHNHGTYTRNTIHNLQHTWKQTQQITHTTRTYNATHRHTTIQDTQ